MTTTKLKDIANSKERTDALQNLMTDVTSRTLQDALETVRNAGGTVDDLAYAPILIADAIVPTVLRLLAADGLLRGYHCTAAMEASTTIRNSILEAVSEVGKKAIENDKRRETPN